MILVAIPAYNCEKQIKRMLIEIINNKSLMSKNIHFLVIDNRSLDKSVSAALDAIKECTEKNRFTIIRNLENRGLGGSQKVAFTWARENNFEFLVILHGDHQARPNDIVDLLKPFQKNPNLAAVLGSRFMSGAHRIGYSKTRTFGNKMLNVAYSLGSLRWIQDLGSGLNIFRVNQFDLKQVYDCSNDFTFNMDLLLTLVKNKQDFKFLPIQWVELDQVSNARTFRVGWQALTTLLRWRVPLQQRKKVRTELNFETIFE